MKPGGSKWVRNCGSMSAALVLKGIDKAHPKTLSGLAHLKCRSIAATPFRQSGNPLSC